MTVTPCLWFDTQAEAAARLYVSLFPGSSIGAVSRYGEEGPGRAGSVRTVSFLLDGQPFMGVNGGPAFTFSPAVSFQISCADQREVDHYWYGLGEGGQPGQCGWLEDRYGVSWQVLPTALPELLADPDPDRAARVVVAMLGMSKLEIAGLRSAAAG